MHVFDTLATQIRRMPGSRWTGEIIATSGLTLEAVGLSRVLAVGDRCAVVGRAGARIPCEVVGAREGRSVLMALGRIEGVAPGSTVEFDGQVAVTRPSDAWRGRIINALGEPADGLGPLPEGEYVADLRATAPPAYARRRMGERMNTGVRVLDLFTPICQGQRLGVFAGSGVGKSTLLSMLARHADADVNVIGLIGERGREVREFIERDLGPEGLAKSIIIVATSDESPLMRRNAALLTLAAAEDQRKRGRHVFLMMDSVTRYANALREIGLASGEPPSTKGYPPSVFAELAALLERAGPGLGRQGDVSAVFTVLVDGGDMDEPVADAVRGILDGHVVLSRAIAERGRYPAVDVLRSISRALPDCASPYENELLKKARALMALYADNEELIRIGAYKRGANEALDEAIERWEALENVLGQRREQTATVAEAFEALAGALSVEGVAMDEDAEARWRDARRAAHAARMKAQAAAQDDDVVEDGGSREELRVWDAGAEGDGGADRLEEDGLLTIDLTAEPAAPDDASGPKRLPAPRGPRAAEPPLVGHKP